MSESDLRELDAYYSFLATFQLPQKVTSVSDLADGTALFEVLSIVDAEYFVQSSRPSAQPSDNWVLRFSALKRLYRLMTQYLADVLRQPAGTLDVPDLQAMAKSYDIGPTLVMCRLTVVIAVQCERNAEFIQKIQSLGERDQHHLMKAIEQVMSKLRSTERDKTDQSLTEDDHYYEMQHERSRVLTQKDTLEKVYQALLEEHRALQTSHDDAVSEREDALAQVSHLRADMDNRRNDKADAYMRQEIDRLRSELQKSEENLAMTETELEKHTSIVTDLTRKVEELQGQAELAIKLKDQVDEYRHAADRLQKTENVMEKYKKKLQEGADLRQQVKSLEKQNADLVDKNASLEEEYRKVAAFKPLMDSYRTQIAELEGKMATRATELEAARFELENTRTQLRRANEERAREAETLELYQERVRELELSSTRRPPPARSDSMPPPAHPARTESEELSAAAVRPAEDDLEEGVPHALGGELDDALSGTTMTDLKLQIKKLTRELESARSNSGDTSRVLVLENLLEDANRMKSRYEQDYLAAHREKLKLQADLEEIRSGRTHGDGTEAAIALRQRLNETVDELDALRRQYAELDVKYETQTKELTIVKSDLTLVNKDQLEILATLRESVNEDKAELEAETSRLQNQLKDLADKNRMQLEQINGLLLEKVTLQSDSIGQREKMLQRERDIGELRASLLGRDLPEDIKSRLLNTHEETLQLQEQVKSLTDKLNKAKQFIKAQDKLFKEQHAKNPTAGLSLDTFEEAETSFRSEKKLLQEELAHQKRLHADTTRRYRKEQELLLSLLHNGGMVSIRGLLGSQQSQTRGGSTSWLGQQRRNLGPVLRRY